MSEFHVPVVRVGAVEKHPNADSLSITRVFLYPVILRTGDFCEGDLAVYIPVDAVVPKSPLFAFLGDSTHIRAKRLRGVFSMGLLVPAPPGSVEGQDVTEVLGIQRYEPPEPAGDEDEKDPGFIPVYTDIEGLRRWPDILRHGEDVVITEKLHGANFRACWRDGRLWIGSHTRIKKEDYSNKFWRAATTHTLARVEGVARGLAIALSESPGIVWYGEVYGEVGGYKYGRTADNEGIAFFDALRMDNREYLDDADFEERRFSLGLERVPVLYRGPWDPTLAFHADGNTKMPAEHGREGFVVKPTKERRDDRIGRVILKQHGEEFLLRKKAR